MNNIEIIRAEYNGKLIDFVIINRGNGEFTSMPKSVYDEMIANQASGTIS